MKEIIEELTGYLKTIEEFDKDMGQDASALHAYLIQLTNFGARANFLMAEWKKKYREEKKRAYYKLAASEYATQKYFAVTLAKDFIDSECSETGYVFDLAERCSRSCTHTVEAIRTVVSSLKSERQFADYQ